ncbi:MAG TPA: FtsX-like permease family protein [Gemmatimonadaceae bacterium]|nr:FtsX-like permease family protein [Gemmatimonadaceae bacterium]
MTLGQYLEQLGQDVRYALRQLAHARGFTIVAALTLALGIGATTAIFSAVYAVVLKPLPYPEPHRLVRIGVRLALGATPRDVLRMVVVQGMRPVLIGIVAGMAAALAVTRVLASQLHGIGAADPVTFVGVAAIVALAAAVAAALPARRAARVDPREALGM